MATRHAVVRHAQGLHARPAELIARTARQFESSVAIVCGSQRIDAKSILDILTLGAAEGTRLQVEAHGLDADKAADDLVRLIESDFIPSGGGGSLSSVGPSSVGLSSVGSSSVGLSSVGSSGVGSSGVGRVRTGFVDGSGAASPSPSGVVGAPVEGAPRSAENG
ncbi:MAG: HPr family phosphocarrier protein [Lacipirellulaceae bacterium]